MNRRCVAQSGKDYRNYAGRGIRVCEGWRNSFESFIADMGQRPSDEYSIDRKNNDGNYSCGHCDECQRNGWPANCRWATVAEQSVNKRQTIRLSDSSPACIISEQNGIDRKLAWHRVANLGWTPEQAASVKPVRGRNQSGEPELIEFNEQKLTRQEWAVKTGIPANRIYQRIHVEGWSIERALTTPAVLGRNQFSNS